jgi:hypothetical protein
MWSRIWTDVSKKHAFEMRVTFVFSVRVISWFTRQGIEYLKCLCSVSQKLPVFHGTRINTGQFKNKVTLSHVYNEVTSEPTITWCKTIVRKTLNSRLATRHFATRSPLAAAARNTFPRQLQTNFDSFPNNCISRDCRLTGYFIINVWKCYLLFVLPCILNKHSRKANNGRSSSLKVWCS